MQRFIFIPLLVALLTPPATTAQDDGFRAEFLQQFNSDARKLVALAEAMPAESFGWRPMEGVSSVEEAYMHIARYNYYYPQSRGGATFPSRPTSLYNRSGATPRSKTPADRALIS